MMHEYIGIEYIFKKNILIYTKDKINFMLLKNSLNQFSKTRSVVKIST